MWRFVPSAIRSTQVSRRQPRLVDVLISSTVSMALTQTNKFERGKGWVLVATLNSAFLFMWQRVFFCGAPPGE